MGGLVVWRGAIGSLLLLRFLRRAYRIDQFTRSRDGLGLGPTRQQPAVPDAVETVRQDVDEKSADELARVKRHALVAAGSLDPIVFVAERDAGRVGGDKAAAGDRDPVGVAGQIGEYLLGSGEWLFAIDEPLGPMQRREIGLERGFASELGVVGEELQAAGLVCGEQHLKHQAAEQSGQDLYRQEKVWAAADPAGAVERYPTTRHDHVDVWMMGHRGAPGVEHRGEADLGAEVLGIGCNRAHCL